eukprot:TRINITY_DN33368_c0_g1_i1.p2 TRINITY_DN33368_c0_g1~~TRINITY_DN33368_c0_g1_i1.p2  ORF type:complete len:147 (+),score=60.86 TRINITY_DN33368_c0_g1_i1:133-573(+)
MAEADRHHTMAAANLCEIRATLEDQLQQHRALQSDHEATALQLVALESRLQAVDEAEKESDGRVAAMRMHVTRMKARVAFCEKENALLDDTRQQPEEAQDKIEVLQAQLQSAMSVREAASMEVDALEGQLESTRSWGKHKRHTRMR